MDGQGFAGVPRTLVSKGEFARRKERAPSAVSNWIADGKISPAAIVGEGHRAKIWVERAELDLARNLDPSQQDSQAKPITVAVGAPPAAVEPAAVSDPIVDDIARRRKADADAAELNAEQARRRLAVDSGRWVDAAEVKAAYTQELARRVTDLDVFITSTLAVELAEAFDLDVKLVTIKAREIYRSYRAGVADDARAESEERAEAMAEAAE